MKHDNAEVGFQVGGQFSPGFGGNRVVYFPLW